MSFSQSIRTVWSKYAVFQGRARRSEYWWWTLFTVIISVICSALMAATGPSVVNIVVNGTNVVPTQSQPPGVGYWIAVALTVIVSLALVLPSLAVTVRRLHDTDRSGWWVLLSLIPVGDIVVLVFLCLAGTVGDNRYGPDPKAQQPPVASL